MPHPPTNFLYDYHPVKLWALENGGEKSVCGCVSGCIDYTSFGMTMPEKSWTASGTGYRWGFNSQEKDDEIYGTGNSYTAEYWQYDARLGRRWNVDPVVKIHESPFATFANNPIWFIDPNGADTIVNPNGEKQNVGDGYAASNDGKLLYGEKLQLKVWDPTALSIKGEYNGNYVDYDPSMHGDLRNVTSALSTIAASLSGSDGVVLQGQVLTNMKNEDGVAQYEQSILNRALSDTRYGNAAFAFDMNEQLIYFGGSPSSNAPLQTQGMMLLVDPLATVFLYPETWNMALTSETWAIGRNVIRARVEIDARGTIKVTYKVEGSLDLQRGDDKSTLYNKIVTPLNCLWQSVGGQETMPTYGSWYKIYQPM